MASTDGNFFSSGPLNYLFLAEVVVVSVTLVFFLFFWSRVVGTVLGFFLRTWLWRKHRIWIEFDALQISPLSGHILFKELKYYSANMSIRVVHGHIAWRYWIWRVSEEGDELTLDGEKARGGKRRKLPCRIVVRVHGLEWCLFNRTPAFDDIIARMEEQEKREAQEKSSPRSSETADSESDGPRRRAGWKATEAAQSGEDPSRVRTATSPTSPTASDDLLPQHPAKDPLPTSVFQPTTVESTTSAVNWLREALPMEVQIHTGGITLGNDATPSLLFVAFKDGVGTWSAAKTRSKLDDYKSVHNYTLKSVKIVTRTNPDYRGPILDHGRQVFEEISRRQPQNPLTLSSLTAPLFSPLIKLFPFLSSTTFFGPPSKPSSEPWKGLPRYRAGVMATELGTLPTEREKQYAKVTTLVDSKELVLNYYTDVAGLVPSNPRSMGPEVDYDIGNGDLPPEWGLDLVFRGGTITYGPWADRQRDTLQKAFTPAVFSHSQQTPHVKPGEPRLHTSMTVLVKFEEQSTLLVPHRESSKDWEYDSEGPGAGRLHASRRHGLLAVTLGAGSTLNYSMGMVASSEGYSTTMVLHLSNLVVTSSVNTKEFLWADTCRVSCKMPSPLQWNIRRDWVFDLNLTKPTINLLRDHITQLSDIAKDWTSGPGSDFYHFVPYQYTFKIALQDYMLRLNLNDHNIIDNPSSLDDNVFLVISGPRLDAKVDIPSVKFAQKSTDVTFAVEASKMKASMSLPLWSTNNSFGTERTQDLGTFGIFDVTGSYLFFSETDPDHIELLTIDVLTRGIEFRTFGWAIRHIFRVKDNYFGMFTNFTTLSEYRDKKDAKAIGDPVDAKYRPGKSDVFEIVLNVTIHEGSLVFPEDLHDCQQAIVASTPEVQVSLRLHDYFMEVVFALQPVKIVSMNMLEPDAPPPAREDALMLDGINLVGNRLFGPQPLTATYLCLWEAEIGRISGHASPSMISSLQKIGATVGLNFSDKANAPPTDIELAADPDITFFKVSLGAVDLTIWSPASALNIVLPSGFSFETNDLATDSYRSMLSVSLPQLDARILVPPSMSSHNWWEVSALSLDLALDMYLAPEGWIESATEQAAFVKSQDELTRRVLSLYESRPTQAPVTHLNGLYLPPPILPPRQPVQREVSFSDSEDETSSSDAASLASTTDTDEVKPIHFPPDRRASGTASFFTAYDDEADITSNDESDPGTSSGSDTSASSTATALPTSKAVLQYSTFSSVLDRYRLLRPSEIFCGAGSAIKVESVRGGRKGQASSTSATVSLSAREATPPGSERHKASATGSLASTANRVIRLSMTKDVRVLFTPLSVGPIGELLTGLASTMDSPEQVIDVLYATEAKRNPGHLAEPPTVAMPSSFIIEVDISGVRLQTIQRVLTKAEVKAISANSSIAQGVSSSGDLHARIEWNSKAIKMLVSSSSTPVPSADETTGSVRWESSLDASLSIDSSVLRVLQATSSADRSQNPSLDPEVLRLSTQALVASVTSTSENTSLQLNVGDSNLDWLNIASELIIGTVYESLRFVSTLDRLSEDISRRKQARVRAVVWSILQSARREKIQTSPACLRPATYLVQSSHMRSSVGWKLLCRMRYCHRLVASANGGKDDDLADRTDDELLAEVWPVLSEWWDEWPGRGKLSIEDVPLLDVVFAGRTREELPEVVQEPTNHQPSLVQTLMARPSVVSFTTGRLRANHRGTFASDSTDGNLVLGPYSFVARTSSASLLEDERPLPVRALRIAVQSTLGDGTTRITPALLLVIRHILKVRKVFESKMIVLEQDREQIQRPRPRRPSSTASTPFGFDRISLEATMAFDTSLIAVDVEELGVKAQSGSGAIFATLVVDLPPPESKLTPDVAASLVLRLKRFTVTASQGDRIDAPASLLAEIDVDDGNSVLSYARKETDSPAAGHVSAVFSVEGVRTQAPANIAQLYEFSESWIDKIKNHKTVVQEIIKEFDPEADPARVLKPQPKPTTPLPSIQVNVLIRRLEFDVRITPRLWVCWSLRDVLAFAEKPHGPRDGALSVEFGLQLGSQSLRFVPTEAALVALPSRGAAFASKISVSVPAIKSSGVYGKPPGSAAARVELVVTLDFVELDFQPEVLDSLHSVFKQIERDMSQLEDLLVKARKGRTASTISSAKAQPPADTQQLLHTVRFALRGFKIGLKGPRSTQYVEASLLQGEVSSPVGSNSEPLWSFSVDELGLSLAQTTIRRRASTSAQSGLDRRYRSAYVTVNFQARNSPFETPKRTRQTTLGKPELRHLQVRLDQVHGTLQATAVGELGDLIDHYGVELERRRQERASELEDFKNRAARVWQADETSREPSSIDPQSPSVPPWLQDRVIEVQVQNVGFAFPLSREEIKSSVSAETRSAVPAFIFSINELGFKTKRDEEGSGRIKDVSMQFTSKFDQADPKSFDGLSHSTLNRVHFPLLTCKVESSSTNGHRLVFVDSSVSEFQLSLDSNLPSYVFRLVDVYEQGKRRLDRLAAQYSFDQYYAPGAATQPAEEEEVDNTPTVTKKKTLEVQATFMFEAGRVSLFSYADLEDKGGVDGASLARPRPGQNIILPTVSMWCEYHDRDQSSSSSVASPTPPEGHAGPALLVNITINSTDNSLSPDILPFFSQLTHAIEHRPKSTAPSSPEITLATLPQTPRQEPALATLTAPPSMGNLQINVSLRIDSSNLKLQSNHHEPVDVGISWESGGFVLGIAPVFQTFTLAANVGGVTATSINKNLPDKPHEVFLVRAQNLALAIQFAPEDPIGGLHRSEKRTLSVTLDTEFSASFDFIRVEDIICFKAIWLDRIPVPQASIAPPPVNARRASSTLAIQADAVATSSHQPAPNTPAAPKAPSNLTTLVLVRVRQITQKVESIPTTLDLEIRDVILQIRVDDDSEKYFFGIGEIKVEAKRLLEGRMVFPRLEFEVERRRNHADLKQAEPRLVEVRMSAARIEAVLSTRQTAEQALQPILKLSCGPVKLSIKDDWTGVLDESVEQVIALDFDVDIGRFDLGASTSTVSRLLEVYAGIKRQINFGVNSSITFSDSYARQHRSKPDNSLSNAATGFVQSAASDLRCNASNVTYTISQNMVLKSQGIAVVLYPKDFRDTEVVRLDLGAVKAGLGRTVTPATPVETRLALSLASLQLKRCWITAATAKELLDKETEGGSVEEWLKRATVGTSSRILNLPDSNITMNSTEDPARTILYDYAMAFGGAVEPSLNYSHLKWLKGAVQDFESNMAAGLKSIPPSIIPSSSLASPIIASNDLPPPAPTSSEGPRAPDADVPAPSLPKSAANGAGEGQEEEDKLVYVKRKADEIQDLQLSHLGEATPGKNWVPWVQSQFSKSSKWTHEWATRPLVVLMEGLLETYKKQLPKA